MANDLILAHRAADPTDTRSDGEINAAYLASPDVASYMAGYPGFAAENKPQAYQPTAFQELGQGLSSGISGLESSGYGAAALTAATVGATGARDYFLAKAQSADEDAAQNPPSVPTIGDIHSATDALHYGARKTGEFLPNIAQAGVTGVIGALAGGVAGGAVEPAGGEVPGAAGGFLYGILESQATKMLIEDAAANGIKKAAGDFAAGELAPVIKNLAKSYGSKIAVVGNFWTQSAGSTYNTLAKNPDVDPQTAINVSILGGLAQAVPSAYLPSTILGKFFGEGASSKASYFARLAEEGAKAIPGGAGAMSLQELGAIASEKYADPKTRDQAFDFSKWTDADKSRLLESSVAGGLMGLVAAPVAGIPKGESPIDRVLKTYASDVTDAEKKDLATLASGELTGTLNLQGKQAISRLNPQQRTAYALIKDGLSKKVAESAPEIKKPTEQDITQAYELAKQAQPEPVVEQPLTSPAVEPNVQNAPASGASGVGNEAAPQEEANAIANPVVQSAPPAAVAPQAEDPLITRAKAVRDAARLRATAALNPDAFENQKPAEPAPVAPINPGGSQENLPPEQQAISRANNSREAFLAANGGKLPGDVAPVEPALANEPTASRVLNEKVINRAGPISLDSISADNPYDTDRRKADYFEIKAEDLKNLDKLEPELVSGSSEGTQAPQTTKRVTIVQDNETGKVYALSTHLDRKYDIVRIADPDKKASSRLTDFLDKKTADGQPKYTPIASMKLNERKNALIQEFADRAAYDKELGDPVKAKIAEARQNTRTLEQAAPSSSTPLPETVSTGEFKAEHADALYDHFGHFQDMGDFKEFADEFNKAIPNDPEDPLVGAIAHLFQEATDQGLTSEEALSATKQKIYDLLKDRNSEGQEAFRESAVRRFNDGGVEETPDTRPAAETPSELPATPTTGQQPAEQQQEGGGGNPVVNPDALRYRQPGDAKPTEASARHAQLLDTIHKAAIDAGLNVTRIGQDISGMAGDFAKQTGAAYDSASRTVSQVVGDVIGREDVITSLHEVAHDVFSRLPEETRSRLLDAVDALSDRSLGVSLSSDPRIRQSNPDGLSRPVLAEERLAEATALKLQAQGFDPNTARGLASQFVRALKGLYLRAAMSIQRSLFGDSFVNPELATRFFQNKVEAFLAGDFTKRSFIHMLGGGEASEPMKGKWHNTSDNLTFERIGANNSIDYNNIPNSTLAAAEFNNLKFRRPQPPNPDEPHSRQVEIEKQAARFNLKQEILDQSVKNPEFSNIAKELKGDPKKLMLDALGLTAPDEFKKTLAGALEQDGTPVKFDADKKIDGFKAASNADAVTADAYRDVQSDLSRVSAVKTAAREAKEDLSRRREKLISDDQEVSKNYTDAQYSTSVATRALQAEARKLFTDTVNESKRLGSIAQQLKALDPTADLKKYTGVFQKLFTGDELKGEKLFNVLDTLANDPKIDFSKSITDIRQQMLAQGGKYDKYVQHTPESRALTAAIVSFAKTHSRIMANLELRRMANGADRVKVAQSLEEIRAKGVNFTKSFKDLPKTAVLEDRAKQAYRKSQSRIASNARQLERAQQKIVAADAMAGVLAKHEAMLAGKLSIGAEAVFRDGMPYNVPPSADASNADVLKATKELKLNTSKNSITSPEEVEADLRKMKAFTDAREAAYANGDFDAKDSVYQGVKRQFEQIAGQKNFNLNAVPAQRFLTPLSFMPDGKKLADGINTPSARRVDERMNSYTSDYTLMSKEASRVGNKTLELEDNLLKMIPQKTADARQYLRENFLRAAKDVFHHSDDLAEKFSGNPDGLRGAIMNRVMTTLLNQESSVKYMRGHEAEWRDGLEKLLNHQGAAAEWQKNRVQEAGLGVLDPSLKTRNPATGQTVPAVRQHISKGPLTFPQRMASNFKDMVNSLKNSGWASTEGKSLAHADFSHIADAIHSGDTEAAQKIVSKYFDKQGHADQVRNQFFKNIAESNKESLFQAPLESDGITRAPVDLALQHQAYQESGGDPLKFAERMWELHDGQEIAGQPSEDGREVVPVQTKGTYIQSIFNDLADTAQEAHNIFSSIEPNSTEFDTAIKGMSANALIDSRKIQHLPSQWFDYHDFDPRDMYKTVERIAAERAFGRGQVALDFDVRTVADEVDQARYKWRAVNNEALRENREATPKELKKIIISKLSKGGTDGAAEYDRLNKLNSRADLVPKFVHGVSDYFRKDNSPDGTLRALTRASHTLGALMINQPSSALTLMTQLVDMNLRFGSSKSVLAQTVKNFGIAGKEIAGSLLNAVGVQVKAGADNQMWNDIGLGDPANMKKFSDIFDRLHGESATAHGFRAIGELMDTGVGKASPFVKFRPAGIFNFAGQVADKAITTGVWNLAKGQMAKGVDFYRNNLEHFQNPDFKLENSPIDIRIKNGETRLSAVHYLGLKGADADTFQRMTSLMQRWGLNYDDMVRGAMKNPDKIGLTNDQATRLYAMAVSEIALSSNLSTMPTAAYNNSIIRFALPLLSWSFRRMGQVGQVALNAEGQRDMKSFARAMAGLSVTAAGGLATTALIDQYYQTALGKQRNLRPITTANGPDEFALSVMENLNRVGTFGLFGEIANDIANTGQGGDNRVLSVDQRVLAISALQSVQQAASAWINQGYNADYAHVVRPLAGALGGGSLIQYLQLANNALGLDNAEARVTARINAQNYLRVVGRELGLDVRESAGGGSYTPTKITPFLTNMELASYKNDPADFRQAYQQAIAAAKEAGHDDPVAYVRSAFESRNPLKSVFSTSISTGDYQRILANLPGSGPQDVSQAVNLFNQYAQSIGGKAYDGKTAKETKTAALSLGDIRQRATAALN